MLDDPIVAEREVTTTTTKALMKSSSSKKKKKKKKKRTKTEKENEKKDVMISDKLEKHGSTRKNNSTTTTMSLSHDPNDDMQCPFTESNKAAGDFSMVQPHSQRNINHDESLMKDGAIEIEKLPTSDHSSSCNTYGNDDSSTNASSTTQPHQPQSTQNLFSSSAVPQGGTTHFSPQPTGTAFQQPQFNLDSWNQQRRRSSSSSLSSSKRKKEREREKPMGDNSSHGTNLSEPFVFSNDTQFPPLHQPWDESPNFHQTDGTSHFSQPHPSSQQQQEQQQQQWGTPWQSHTSPQEHPHHNHQHHQQQEQQPPSWEHDKLLFPGQQHQLEKPPRVQRDHLHPQQQNAVQQQHHQTNTPHPQSISHAQSHAGSTSSLMSEISMDAAIQQHKMKRSAYDVFETIAEENWDPPQFEWGTSDVWQSHRTKMSFQSSIWDSDDDNDVSAPKNKNTTNTRSQPISRRNKSTYSVVTASTIETGTTDGYITGGDEIGSTDSLSTPSSRIRKQHDDGIPNALRPPMRSSQSGIVVDPKQMYFDEPQNSKLFLQKESLSIRDLMQIREEETETRNPQSRQPPSRNSITITEANRVMGAPTEHETPPLNQQHPHDSDGSDFKLADTNWGSFENSNQSQEDFSASIHMESKEQDPQKDTQKSRKNADNSFFQRAALASMMSGDYSPAPGLIGDSGSNELLIKYLKSMGASTRTAEAIAQSFVQEQNSMHSLNFDFEADSRKSSSRESSRSIAKKQSTRKNTENFAGTAVSEKAMLSKAFASNMDEEKAQHKLASLWPRSSEPGAVQMTGIAFGAPTTLTIPDTAFGGENETRVDALATAKSKAREPPRRADEEEIFSSEPEPTEERRILKTKAAKWWIFGSCVLLFVVAVIVVVLFTRVPPEVEPQEYMGPRENIFPSAVPSQAPTFISADVLDKAFLISGDVANNVESPQHRAVGWLSTKNQVDISDDERFLQRYAIVTLFYSTMGESWLVKDDWLSADKHECEWSQTFISCREEATGSRIIQSINLSSNGLGGSLPPEIGQLDRLERLEASNNTIEGSIPSAVFDTTSLIVFNLSSNNLQGSLPETMRNAKNLEALDLSFNNITGTIPNNFYELTNLQEILLSSNRLTGTIASNIGNMRLLKTLNMRSNLLTGVLPEINIDGLQFFIDFVRLDNNMLTGSLPAWVVDPTLHQEVTLSHNSFTGSVSMRESDPSNTRVRLVDLRDNQLTGQIPSWAGNFSTLEHLDVSNNNMSGTIPFGDTGSGWVGLRWFNAANNRLSGRLPLNPAPDLFHFDVSGNQLTGGIPTEICDYGELREMKLSNNPLGGNVQDLLTCTTALSNVLAENCGLTGTLPGSILTKMTNVKVLSLASNNLTGTIPSEIGGLVNVRELFLHENNLVGPLPSQVGLLQGLQQLRLENNQLSSSLPNELGRIESLKSLNIFGNDALEGSVPLDLCRFITNLTRAQVGCDLDCICCTDPDGVCERDNIFSRTQGKPKGAF